MTELRPSELDAELDDWVVDFLRAEEAGTSSDDPTRLLLRPELRVRATRLATFHRRLHELTKPFRRAVQQTRPSAKSDQTGSYFPADLLHENHTPPEELPRRLGAFELLERIGYGGMGVVYRAKQVSLQRIVAVKTTRAEYLLGESELQRFRNEAEFVARLDHPGIVPVYEVGLVDGELFYSMRLLEGGDLGQRLDQFRSDPHAAAELLVKVARAVHHAHQRGVLHRDLKPSNILLDEQRQPLVADFGLARRIAVHDTGVSRLGLRPDPIETGISPPSVRTGTNFESVGTESQPTPESLTRSGLLIGTPGYMAPEQVSGLSSELTTATDVYGLGAVLYALLTGRPPFRGRDAFDTLTQVKAGEPTPPQQHNPVADRDLECICLKCLAREPERRYRSAADVADELQRWLAGEPIVARPAGRWERFWRRCRRHPAIAGLSFVVATLLTTLLCGLAVSVVLLRGEQAETRKHEVAAQNEARNARQREAETRRMLYVSDISQAARTWESSDLPRMSQLLDRHLPSREADEDLRGFEWRYLRQLAHSRDDVVSLGRRHQGQVFCVTISPDGRRLATSGEDRRVLVSDFATGQSLFELTGFADDANAIVFSRDGKTMIASGEDGSIWTCDANTGANPAKRFQTSGYDPVRQLDFNADGSVLVANCADSFVRRFEFPSMRELPESALTTAHPLKPGPVRFSPDGATLITCGHEGTVLVWDAATLKLRHQFQDWSEVRALEVAHRRPWAAACGNDQTVRIFDYQSGRVLHRLTGFVDQVLSVAISPDDAFLAAADRTGCIRVWELESGRLWNLLPGNQYVWSLTFAPDSRTILAGDFSGHVWKWNVEAPRIRQTIAQSEDSLRQIMYLPQTQEFAWLSQKRGHVTVTDSDSIGRKPGTTELRTNSLNQDVRTESVFSKDHVVTFAGDGKRWLVGEPNGTIALWDRGESQPRWKIPAHPHWVNSVAFAPDGKSVISVSADDRIRLWDIATGEPRGTIEIDEYPSLMFVLAADGRTVAIASQKNLALVDLATREVRRRFGRPDERSVAAIAFSSDGSLLAVANRNRSIEIWSTQVESPPRILSGHTHSVTSLAFSPDNRTLASAAHDGTVRLWSVLLGQELLNLQSAHVNNSVLFSPDGQHLVVAGDNQPGQGVVYSWTAPTAEFGKRQGVRPPNMPEVLQSSDKY